MANYTSCKIVLFMHMNTHYTAVSGDPSCHGHIGHNLSQVRIIFASHYIKGQIPVTWFSSTHIPKGYSGTLKTQW